MKMEQTECSETSAYKIQTPGNYPEENIQHSEHGESLKSKIILYFCHPKSEIFLTGLILLYKIFDTKTSLLFQFPYGLCC
jgi:hypothetical protein